MYKQVKDPANQQSVAPNLTAIFANLKDPAHRINPMLSLRDFRTLIIRLSGF